MIFLIHLVPSDINVANRDGPCGTSRQGGPCPGAPQARPIRADDAEAGREQGTGGGNDELQVKPFIRPRPFEHQRGSVASKIFLDGKMVPDEGFERGQMLVHTKDEWRRRFEAALERVNRRVLRLFFSLGALLLVVAVVAWMFLPEDFNRDRLVFSLVCIGIFTIFVPFPVCWNLKRKVGRSPAPGLYENGVQYNHEVFIQYSEVSRTERKVLAGENILALSRYEDVSGQQGSKPWLVSFEFLGEDAVEELERRVRRRPDLVVYQ